MLRAVFIAIPLVLAPLALSSVADARSRPDNRRCERNEERHRGGGLLGGLARGALGRFGGSAVATVVSPVGSLMGEAIMNLLDCREQRQAANATEEAVQGGVGATSAWRSETRTNVSGSSTVTGAEPVVVAGSAQCLTVTDIVIIDGEETRAPKRMCRTPPSNRYVKV